MEHSGKRKNSSLLRLRLRGVLLIAVLLFSLGGRAMASGTEAAKVQLEYLCSWMSLAAYNDRLGTLAREELASSGWLIERVQSYGAKADAKYLIARRKEMQEKPLYLVTVTGTESRGDLRSDAGFARCYFAGASPEEFAEMAAKPDTAESEPLVHRGFNSYTQQAFFQPEEDGLSVGERLRDLMIDNPEVRVCLTGHSLGGAVATLLGQRLLDMGAPAEQLRVVTFGAPPVGNKAFAEHAASLQLDRVVISSDPVVRLLALGPKLEHAGTETKLERSSNSKRFHHAMMSYLDATLKNYYDAVPEGQGMPEWMQPEALLTQPVYLVQRVELTELIEDDVPYLKRASAEYVGRQFAEVVQGEWAGYREAMRQAKKAGCSYVLMQEYSSQRRKDKDYEFSVVLNETIYDVEGNLLASQSFTTGTRDLPPVFAALYNAVQGREAREQAVAGLKK